MATITTTTPTPLSSFFDFTICEFFSIDPGLKNFSISNFETKKNLRINFKTLTHYLQHLPHLLSQLFSSVVSKPVHIFIERQHVLKRFNNPNIKLEYFLRGILATFPLLCVHEIAPLEKKQYALFALSWTYTKIKSRKRFTQEYTSNQNLQKLLDGWQCFHWDDVDSKLICFDTIFTQKKYDDFIDTLLLLEIGRRRHDATTTTPTAARV